ncbi:MAG: hypothetical protein AAFY98_03135 [Verrucomicrobiota bacterium]
MKSAYERAMEKLGSSDQPSLNEDQKKQIAEVNSKFEAKIAERKTFLESKIQSAHASGQMEEAAELESGLQRDLATIREEWDFAKKKIWDA